MEINFTEKELKENVLIDQFISFCNFLKDTYTENIYVALNPIYKNYGDITLLTTTEFKKHRKSLLSLLGNLDEYTLHCEIEIVDSISDRLKEDLVALLSLTLYDKIKNKKIKTIHFR